jgi:prolyl oligopeptidase
MNDPIRYFGNCSFLPLVALTLCGLAVLALGCARRANTSSAPPRQPAAADVASTDTSPDPYLWLEDVTGDKALDWVRQQNALSTRELEASPDFEPIRQRLLAIFNSKERIPTVVQYGTYLYNFWRDEQNVRGLWRRTTLAEYRKPSPAWETVLDVDELATKEKENWVWHGASVLEPEKDLCLIELSRGGADATVVREFDLTRKEFVTDGFTLAEAKNNVDWRNRNTLYVGTDFGSGSLTKSGYPRLVKEWKRGTPLTEARTVFEGKPDDVGVGASVAHDHGHVYEWLSRHVTFFTDEAFLRQGEDWVRLDKPADAEATTFAEHLLLRLRTDWTVGGKTYAGGSLLAINFAAYLKGDRHLTALFVPTERKSLEDISSTKSYLILSELENVRSRPYLVRFADGQWTRTALEAPDFGTVATTGLDPDESDDYFMVVTDFVTPSSLYLGVAGQTGREKLKSLPAFFNTEGLEIQQFEAVSKDGTRVPYFQVSRKSLPLDGQNPTLLYGYGGFEIPMLSQYSAGLGAAWLERGGTYVLANIRGGGEFGPTWHEAARKANRQRAYDDFIAVAEHLVARKVTSPKHLGIEGASNGGLLMGVMLTERPDLFGAVVCQVPLLDMRRYNKLLAGASWMDEYGDPDKPEEWAWLRAYSPYQNVRANRSYPRVLFTTSARDDRVHPGHARKMVARMKEQGHDVLYYENIEGGHGGAADNKQRAYMDALAYTFLLKQLR